MKKTLYVYGTPGNGIFLRDAEIKNKTEYPLIGTTELEITPAAKPFPKAMKYGETGLVVYFPKPKRGYVLVEDEYHAKNEYRDDWCTDCFTDIKGIQEVV
jgi:hypothetical protein